jgi:hypothetical protein
VPICRRKQLEVFLSDKFASLSELIVGTGFSFSHAVQKRVELRRRRSLFFRKVGFIYAAFACPLPVGRKLGLVLDGFGVGLRPPPWFGLGFSLAVGLRVSP